MAEQRRMFSSSVLNTDEFAELSATAKVLYFAMNMEADDYGFLKCAKQVMRMQNAKQKDLDALKAAGFILCFDSGVVLIRHWHIHNCIRPDRKRDTAFKEEFRLVTLNECKVYELTPKKSPQTKENQQPLSATCPPNSGQMSAVCPIDDGQLTGKCPHSTVQVSTVQGNTVQDSTGKESTGEVNPKEKERELKTGVLTLSSLGGTSRGTSSETSRTGDADAGLGMGRAGDAEAMQRTLPPRELAASQTLSSSPMMQQGTAFKPSLSMPDGTEFSSVNGMNGREMQVPTDEREATLTPSPSMPDGTGFSSGKRMNGREMPDGFGEREMQAASGKQGMTTWATFAQRETESSDEPSETVKMAQKMAREALYGKPSNEPTAPSDGQESPDTAKKSPVNPSPVSSCDPYVFPTAERLAASEAQVRAAFERLRRKKERTE